MCRDGTQASWLPGKLSAELHRSHLWPAFLFFNLMLHHDKISNLKNSFTATVLMTACLKHSLMTWYKSGYV